MSFDIEIVMDMYLKAKKENLEQKIWEQWLVDYGKWKDKKQFISFEDYKEKVLKIKTVEKKEVNKKEALERAEAIKKMDQGRR